jgi:VIT1/CCC1 family predicted Fe2+/Mn2+ transporter
MARSRAEHHFITRIGWLRAAVLGANDGIISTASLIVGVASAATSAREVLTAGIAGLVAGAMSMAAGEYVSVSSQADSERADLRREKQELVDDPESETRELAQIYVSRGLDAALARQVAAQLMASNPLAAHARDELGISEASAARPIQAGLTSAAAFSIGAAFPVIAAIVTPLLTPANLVVPVVSGTALVLLALLGAIGARAGGAGILRPTFRVAFWGAMAMGITAGIGTLVGRAV